MTAHTPGLGDLWDTYFLTDSGPSPEGNPPGPRVCSDPAFEGQYEAFPERSGIVQPSVGTHPELS